MVANCRSRIQIHGCSHCSLCGGTKGNRMHAFGITSLLFSGMFQVLALVSMLALLLLQLFIHPYKNKMANYLESFAILVLIMLLGFGNTSAFVESLDVALWPLFYLPVFIEIAVIAVYVGYILW